MFFFVLASLARCSISIGLLDRPLVIATCFGFLTNNLELALLLGAALELFWLDTLRLGAIIPPSGSLAFLLLYPIILLFDLQSPNEFVLPLLLCLPLSYSIKWLELRERKITNNNIAAVEQWIDDSSKGLNPASLIHKSLLRFIMLYAILYLILFFLLYYVVMFLVKADFLFNIKYFDWLTLYAISIVGAVLALRIKRAYATLFVVILLIFFYKEFVST